MISKNLVDHETDFYDQQISLLLEGEHQEALENLTSFCDVEQAGESQNSRSASACSTQGVENAFLSEDFKNAAGCRARDISSGIEVRRLKDRPTEEPIQGHDSVLGMRQVRDTTLLFLIEV